MALLTAPLAAQQIDYTDGQTDGNTYDTTLGLTLSILSGTATQSGVISGSGRLTKTGLGTLILSGVNDYTDDTVVRAGTLQVVSGASMSQAPANIFVADVTGDIGSLLISGGNVSSAGGYIGVHAGSSGTVTISDGTWDNTSTLYVGTEGSGILNLTGGSVSDNFGYLGYLPGSNGTANVSGGTWTNYNTFYIGNLGTGTLNLSGGSVNNDSSYLGYLPGSSGTANVSGGTWTNNSELSVGYYGAGVLNLSGGSVSNGIGYLGYGSGSSGTANVSNGTWTNNGDLNIGNDGTGVLNLSGGSVSNLTGYLGYDSGSTGTANVSGGTWTNNGAIVIGDSGTGVLNLSGGSITAEVVYQGLNAGSSGTVNVSSGTLTSNTSYLLGYAGSGVLNLSGGSITNLSSSVGVFFGISGTANVSGGTWTNNDSLVIGEYGTGVLNLSGGSVTAEVIRQGLNAGSSGTVNVSGGTLTSNTSYFLGYSGSAVLNLSGGSISNLSSSMGFEAGGSGTANVSGGVWTNDGSLVIGEVGTGVLNLSGGSVTAQIVYLGLNAGSSGTLNIGTGGAAGTLDTNSISGGDGTAVVNFNHTGSLNFAPTLEGRMTVNQIGPGTTTLTQANTYLGDTFVLSGTLELGFGAVSSDILPTNTALHMGNGTLLLTGEGTQTVSGLYAIGSGSIVLGQNQTLDLGLLGSIAPSAALNFDTSAGGADGATVGSGIILLGGQSAGSIISSHLTVTDSTGFGLATVNASNQIIRHSTDLLPASGGSYSDYRIDNNAGDSTTAGSAALVVTSSQSVVSITVDTTAAAGVLTLDPGVVLSSNIWNFGSATGSGHAYEITGGDSGAGITASTPGSSIQINNYNSAPVTISAPILDSGFNSGLDITGPGTTILTAVNTYTASTVVYDGVLVVAAGGSISTTGASTTLVGVGMGSSATLLISGGSVSDTTSILGNTAGAFGTATVSSGSWTTNNDRQIGSSGTGVLNVSGTGSVSSSRLTLGSASGSSGTLNMSGGNWNTDATLTIGDHGTGVVNLSGGTVSSYTFFLGNSSGGSGTLNMSGGNWFSSGTIFVGMGGSGVVNLSGGTLISASAVLGNSSSSSGGTVNMSGGNWFNATVFMVGYDSTAVLNLSGGALSNYDGFLGTGTGTGTANVSGGEWTTNGTLYVGYSGTGVLNLTDSGTVNVGLEGSGTLTLANYVGSSGTLNIGTGGAAGTLNAASVSGGDGTAVVNFNHTGSLNFTPTLDGSLSVNQIGPGTTTLTAANTYTGTTSVLGGTLELEFSIGVTQNILPLTTDLTLGSGKLLITGGGGFQVLNSLSLRAGSAASIVLDGPNQSLALGTLGSVGSLSSLHFDVAAGGADGSIIGSSVIWLTGQTAGVALNPGITITDATGFGLATVDPGSAVIRLTTSDLLPASGADAGTDYRIDNNSGGSTAAGSSSLIVTDSQTARSITVDTTLTYGVLTLGSDVVLSSDVWNFGGNGSNGFEINIDGAGAGIQAASAGGMLQINNFNAGAVFISAPILDNGGSGLQVAGTGVTYLNGENTYTGDTLVTGGTLAINTSGSIISDGKTTVGSQTGDNAVLNIFGSMTNAAAVLGDAAGALGTALVDEDASWYNNLDLTVGKSGTGVLNINQAYVASASSYIGLNAGSSGMVTVTGRHAEWDVYGDLTVGQSGTGVLNINQGYVTSDNGSVGANAGSSGTVNVSGRHGEWYLNGDLAIGQSGTGVLNIDQGYVESSNGSVGANAGSSGTVNVSNGGAWYLYGDLDIGRNGSGVLNLTDLGVVAVDDGYGTLTLGAQGTLNIGTGGIAGLLAAETVAGASGAVVNFNYNFLSSSLGYSTVLTGDLAVNKLGGGLLTFYNQNTYTGATTVNGGTLNLVFDGITTDIISSRSALTLGGGTLSLYAYDPSSQTFNGLTTTAGTSSQIYLSSDVTLDLGALTSAGSGSALNFDLYEGGADGATVGTGIVQLSGQTAGAAISSGFTVTDATGFGLATVNDLNQIIRLTTSDLLPASGADAGTDYRIDNNDGGSTAPGSSTLEITASQTARSITVDSTTATGVLSLASGVILSSDLWNFGGQNDYEITGSDSGAGISAATAGGMLQINNYNLGGVVTITAPILDNGGSGLHVAGTGFTALNGADTYTGETIITSGGLIIDGDHSAATGTVTVQSGALLAGTGTLGGDIQVQAGGMLVAGGLESDGILSGTTATFAPNSIFYVQGGGGTFSSLHLSGAVTIDSGAAIYISVYDDLTLNSYTLLTAASGLDDSHSFNSPIFAGLPYGYKLVYTGTELDLVIIAPAVAYWTGKVDNNWSTVSAGSTNWATAIDGLTDTVELPDFPTDVTFSATGVGLQQTNLDVDFTVKSLTVDTATTISTTGTQTLTVNEATTVNALLAINSGVTLIGQDDLTVSTSGNLAGSGSVEMAADHSIFANGAISVGDPTVSSAQILSLTTSGSGAVVMGHSSLLIVNLYTGAGAGDNTASLSAADQLSLHGTLDATGGGTLVISNHLVTPVFAGGDQWKVIDLNSGDGTITGALALNDSALGLATGFVGSFDQTTGIYSIADRRGEFTAYSSGLPMANAESQAIISGAQTALSDVNNHLFSLRNGGGEEEDDSDDSISAALDYGVVVGEGDGPEDKNPIAKRVKRSRQWEVFTTVNYGNAKLNPISSQAGVQIDSWASSVGLERHVSRSVIVGFAATFLQSTQTYTSGLGKVDLEGPMLSAYVSYVHKGFWSSLLYSFGDFDLGSQRNPGLGLPTAAGGTRAYTHAIQYNTGYNFRFQNHTLVTGPFIGIDYLHGSVDAYSETGGGIGALAYGKQSFESLVTRVGWSLSKKFETNWAVITPQVRVSYERQNVKNNGTSVSLINAPFTAAGGNQTPGQDYVVFGTGVNFQFTPEFSMLLGYQVQLFRNNMESHFGSVRFGYKF